MQVTSIMGVRKGVNKRWGTIDPSQYSVRQLFYYFRQVQVTITDGTTSYYLDLSTLPTQYYTYDGTISALIPTLNPNQLTYTTTGIKLNNQKAVCYASDQLGYALNLTSASGIVLDNPDASNYLLLNNYTNLYMDVDTYETCLIAYNGLYHLPNYLKGVGIALTNGAASALKQNHSLKASILDFSAVGSLTYESFTNSKLTFPFDQTIAVTLTTNLTNKSVLFSIGGILHTVDDTMIRQVGVNQYLFNITPLISPKLITHLGLFIDIGPVLSQITTETNNLTQEQLMALFTLSQTFAVVIDAKEIYTANYFVENIHNPNKYYSYQAPLAALVDEFGKHIPYNRSSFADRYVINPHHPPQYTFDTANSGLTANMQFGMSSNQCAGNYQLVEYGKDY